MGKVAFFLDGGFVKKRLQRTLGRFPAVDDVVAHVRERMETPLLQRFDLLRVYYYDAPPYTGQQQNPVDRSKTNYASTEVARLHGGLLDALELQPDFAVRRGRLAWEGWRVRSRALKDLARSQRALQADDLAPNLKQKGVDMRVGLDMALIATRRLVDIVVLVTGDSDFVPAMKLVRREGVRVYLDPLGYEGIRRELKAHADRVFQRSSPA